MDQKLSEKRWSTEDELNFIAGIGTFQDKNKDRIINPRPLLVGYLEGCEKRVNWGKINKAEVMAYATKELEILGGVGVDE